MIRKGIMSKKSPLSIKKEIGKRFKQFREAMGNTQAQLARELGVYQSTITNIEVGKTFPGLKYLHHFQKSYLLNVNWLLNGVGEMFGVEQARPPAVSLIPCHIPEKDPRFAKYAELIDLMQVPVVEQVVLAKLIEIKVIAREEIEKFLKLRKKIREAQ
jgi:transcriptional regulator with XRE-family HTH domain